MEMWIGFTLLAATLQAVRTAAQKQLSSSISEMATTLVRYLWGLPFVFIYLIFLLVSNKEWQGFDFWGRISNPTFIFYASIAGLAQIGGTFALIKVLKTRNFAVGTTLAKTEAIMVALMAWIIFQEKLGLVAWLSIILGIVGTLVISMPTLSWKGFTSSSLYGLLSGLGFAFASLFLRHASLSLELPLLLSASITLAFMVSLQTIICTAIVHKNEPKQWGLMAKHYRGCIFVGVTSAVGSIGWFTAMSYQNAALVKTLGQVEFFLTLIITRHIFREKISMRESVGMVLIIVSILMLFNMG